jgi:hypothetical protein
MSIEIYGSRFRDGELAGLEFSALIGAFAGLMVRQEPEALVLRLEDSGGVTTLLGFKTSGGEVISLCVPRPVADPRLYAALLELLQHEGVVVYAPGSAPVFGDPASERHLPEGMRSALGIGVVVETVDALKNALFGGLLTLGHAGTHNSDMP